MSVIASIVESPSLASCPRIHDDACRLILFLDVDAQPPAEPSPPPHIPSLLRGIGVERPALEIPYEELDVRDQIGGGGFSLVYRAFWKGTPVAVKRWFDPDQTEKVMQEFREEVMTMQDLKHPNCVQLIGACSKPPNLAIVMEYMPYSLHFILHQSPARRRGRA